MRTLLRRSAAVLACALSCATAINVADAVEVKGLYETIVTPTDKSRDSIFTAAMAQIAVRVSGDRSAGDRVLANKPNVRRYVQSFSFEPDGSANVRFDSVSFDQLLNAAGLSIWSRQRPGVLVWLSVTDAQGRTLWESISDHSAERSAIEQTAYARGLPLIWPNMDAADSNTVAGFLAGSHSYEQLMASAEHYRADAVLLGIETRDASGATSIRWTFAFNGQATDFQGAPEEGLQIAADRCATLLAVASGVHNDVSVQVSGIRDLDSYARVISYFEELSIANHIDVDQLQGDRLDLRISVRGDANSLRRTIALGKRLVSVASTPDASGNSGKILKFELRP